ncbi:MAG: universal stress protein [Bryobacteraceae bacterium]
MLSLDRILVPVDFSPRSEGAARYAAVIAGHFHSSITLLHALPVPHYELGAGLLGDLFPERERSAREALLKFARAQLGSIHPQLVVAKGDPGARIVEQAHQDGGLIVMPTHGLNPIRRLLLGSTAAHVLRYAHCAVCTGVHLDNAPPQPKFENVVCAVDAGPGSEAVVEWAARFSRTSQARLFIVHAVIAPEHDEEEESLDGTAADFLRELQSKLNTHATAIVAGGPDAAKTIGRQLRALSADLLVIGRGDFSRLRTTSDGLIHESICPVVSV